MSFFNNFIYLLKKHSLFRLALFLFVLIFFSGLSLIVTLVSKKPPELYSITPQIALPGDNAVVSGKHFGNNIEDSYVEIGGSRLTSSNYTSWSDSEIQLTLPLNVQDGLVYVVTASGRSKAVNFANKATIPVLVKNNIQSSTPQIVNITEKNGIIGKVITINGKNLGTLRNSSQVFFSIQNDQSSTPEYIACSDDNFDYEFWSDQEIRVRIPDGANSGNIYIQTDKGDSNFYHLDIQNNIGTKNFTDKKTYLLSVSADITATEFKGNADLILRVPKPPVTPTQRKIEVPVSNPEPVISDYMNTIVHQTTLNSRQKSKFSVAHSFVVPVYAEQTKINPERVKPYSEETKLIYSSYLKEDEIVLSSSPKIVELQQKITGKISNPYTKAKSIYTYMIDNFHILYELRSSEAAITDLLTTENGDAYDFALIYCSLARSAGIPCIPVSGVYVDANMESHNHWWCEFYIEDFGWVPVDSALGAGLEYANFNKTISPKEYYFGNLDSQHVTFSRGWNKIRSAHINGKVVYRPKTYALQSIWEEASTTVQTYSSFWSNVYVTGVY